MVTKKKANIFLGILGTMLGTIPGIIIFCIALNFNWVVTALSALFISFGSKYGYLIFMKRDFKFEGFKISILEALLITVISLIVVYILNAIDLTNILYSEFKGEHSYISLFSKYFYNLFEVSVISNQLILSEVAVLISGLAVELGVRFI